MACDRYSYIEFYTVDGASKSVDCARNHAHTDATTASIGLCATSTSSHLTNLLCHCLYTHTASTPLTDLGVLASAAAAATTVSLFIQRNCATFRSCGHKWSSRWLTFSRGFFLKLVTQLTKFGWCLGLSDALFFSSIYSWRPSTVNVDYRTMS